MKNTIRLFLFVVILSVIAVNSSFGQQAKYVFYFIGDGMGLNQVNGTEMYLGTLEDRIGITSLCFTGFPVLSVATSFSGTHPITDSAAAGTALATGKKTQNGGIGVDESGQSILSVASWAKNAGRKVGVATSVSVDHATPAAFYAHRHNRGLYYAIATDLPRSGFDFYAGSGFVQPNDPESPHKENIFKLFKRTGYTIARGYNDFRKQYSQVDKMILIQEAQKDVYSLPYAIDRKSDDLTLTQITESAIDFLTKDNDKGFFLMIEGGKIDWSCHANDAATTFQEIIDMDKAVRIAYEFYKKHPDETLIVVTADHETGGLGLGIGPSEMNLKALSYQKVSQTGLSAKIRNLRIAQKNNVSWKDIKKILEEYMGFWKELSLTEVQEQELKDEYQNSFSGGVVELTESEYARDEPLAAVAKKIINEIAKVGWVSGGHSAAYVPIFAIGAGADLLHGRIDNTDIPKKIAQAGGY